MYQQRWQLGFVILFLCGTTFVPAAEEFPYTATVAHHNVLARSGPTHRAYPTEKLPRGSQVEVYQTGAEGWLAIRPPEKAFDWLPASAVELAEDNLARVLDDFPAFIGSNVEKVESHLSQVTLQKGDTVQILAEKQVGSGKSAETWYKIEPPPGEFRWVQAKFLTRQSPEALAAADEERLQAREEAYREMNREQPPGVLGRLTREREKNSTSTQQDVVERIKQRLEERRPRDPVKPLAGETSVANSAPATRATAPIGSAVEQEKTRPSLDPRDFVREHKTAESAAPLATEFSDEFKKLRAKEFERSLAEIELELTQMVAQDQSLWRMNPLQARAEELVAQGSTPLERGRARLVQEKIAQFAATLPPGFEEPATLPTKLPGLPNNYALANGKEPSPDQYDGLGYLVAAKIAPAGVPKYQLVDDKGNLLQYVTPAPGINLESYVGKRVGVKGPRGYAASLKQQHVVAERVINIERQLR